jgi:hypothetical protein
MTTTPNVPIPTPDELLEAGLDYAKEVANRMLRSYTKGIVPQVAVFLRHLDTQKVGPVIAIVDYSNCNTPAKRKQELHNAGRVFVRQIRAGRVISDDGNKERREVPEVDYHHPLLAIHITEVWYVDMDEMKAEGKLPSESAKRKEAVAIDCFGSDGRNTVLMADIRRNKRGNALPLVFSDKDEVESSNSPAALFLLGMRAEIVAGHRLN